VTALIASQITPMVITFNEAENISRCLDRLRWARQVLVVDSGSTDATLEIARRYDNVTVVHRAFDDFAAQCNFGLTQIASAWVLSLDADYELSSDLASELQHLIESAAAGYSARFVYRMYGTPLTASLYPPRVVLYRRSAAVYRNEGHGHRVVIDGVVSGLRYPIFHDDRKSLSRWLASQLKYARLEAEHLVGAPRSELGRIDRIRLMAWPAPVLVPLYTAFVKRCIFDGWAGWYYVLQRACAETLIAIEIVDRRLRAKNTDKNKRPANDQPPT
jgi:glycosyltransferase involved in cell wall biosynthesis